MIEVELPDGRVVEFPDGTPHEEMSRAIQTIPGMQRETTWGEFGTGAALDLGIGAMRATKTLPDLAAFVLPDQWTNPASEFFERGIAAAEALKPDAYRSEQQRTAIKRDTEGNFAGLQVPSAESVLGITLGSVPQIPLFLLGGGPLAAGLKSMKYLRAHPLLAQSLGYGAVNAAIVAPDQWRQTYHEAIAAKMPEAEAREAANAAALITAAVSGMTGTLGGAVATKLGAASSTVPRAVAKGFVAEAPFEGIEEAGQSFSEDIGMGRSMQYLNAADRGLMGFIGGGVPGAGIAGFENIAQRQFMPLTNAEVERERLAREAEAEYLARSAGILGQGPQQPTTGTAIVPARTSTPPANPVQAAAEVAATIQQRLGADFPLTQFMAQETPTKPGFWVVRDELGQQHGPDLSQQEATILASMLTERAASRIVENDVDTSLNRAEAAGTEYTPLQRLGMQLLGRRIFHPRENTFTADQINKAAGTPVATELRTYTIAEAKKLLGDRTGNLDNYTPAIIGGATKADGGRGVETFKSVKDGETYAVQSDFTKEKIKSGFDPQTGQRTPFNTAEEADQYAKNLNAKIKRGDPVYRAEITEPGVITAEKITELLQDKNITSGLQSAEMAPIIRAATGQEKVSNLSPQDLQLLYHRLRSMPIFDKPTQIPDFRPRQYTPQQYVIASQMARQAAAQAPQGAQFNEAIPTSEALQKRAGRLSDEAYAELAGDLRNDGRWKKTAEQERQTDQQRQKVAVERQQAHQREVNAVAAAVRQRLSSMRLNNVRSTMMDYLRFAARGPTGETILGDVRSKSSFGAYQRSMNEIFVALEAIKSRPEYEAVANESEEIRISKLVDLALDTLNHEMLHAMRQADLFTKGEWEILQKLTRNQQRPEAWVDVNGKRVTGTYLDWAQQVYGDQNGLIQQEEAIAELIRDGLRGLLPNIGGKPRNIFQKVLEFLRGIVGLKEAGGYSNFEDILTGITSGQIGARPTVDAQGRPVVRTMRRTEQSLVAQSEAWMDAFTEAVKKGMPEVQAQEQADRAAKAAGQELGIDLEEQRSGVLESTGERQLEGADNRRAMELLAQSMYSKNLSQIIGKELFQNAVDAVMKDAPGKQKAIFYGHGYSPDVFVMADTGVGMEPELVVDKFLRAFVSGKSVGEGGGFGLAKLAFLGNSEKFDIITVGVEKATGRKVKTTLNGTGKGFLQFNSNPPKVRFRPDKEITLAPDFTMKFTYDIPADTPTGSAFKFKPPDNPYRAVATVESAADYVDSITFYRIRENFGRHTSAPVGGTQLLEELGFYLKEYEAEQAAEELAEKRSYGVLQSYSLPNADIDILARDGAKMSKGSYFRITILNRSIMQFTTPMMFPEDVVIPEGIAVNIKPKVPAGSADYPFTTNREAVTDDISRQINEFFKETGRRELLKLHAKYATALQDATPIGATGKVLLDAGSRVPQAELNEIANSPSVQRVLQDVTEIQEGILRMLARKFGSPYGRASFAGLLVGARAYGVHFGKPQAHEPSTIYHDIWKEMSYAREELDTIEGNTPELVGKGPEGRLRSLYDVFLTKVTGVALHEALHQNTSSEGEELARELTFKAGDIVDTVVSLMNKGVHTYEELIETVNDITNQGEQLSQYEDAQEAGEFITAQGGYDGYAMAESQRPGEGPQRVDRNPDQEVTDEATAYPYRVVGVGNMWAVQNPDGNNDTQRFPTPEQAEQHARSLKDQFLTQHGYDYMDDVLYSRASKARYLPQRLANIKRDWLKADNKVLAAIAFIDPGDFIDVATPDVGPHWGQRGWKSLIHSEVRPLNVERLRADRQTPWLNVAAKRLYDPSEKSRQWEVWAHEGRHRNGGMAKAGIHEAPVLLVLGAPPAHTIGLSPEQKNRRAKSYSKAEWERLNMPATGVLHGQNYDAAMNYAPDVYNAPVNADTARYWNMIPVTAENWAEIERVFGPPPGEAEVLEQFVLPGIQRRPKGYKKLSRTDLEYIQRQEDRDYQEFVQHQQERRQIGEPVRMPEPQTEPARVYRPKYGAAESDTLLFQRDERRRVGTTGQYIGAPQGTDTPQKLAGLLTKVRQLAEEGGYGRYWYSRSAEMILRITQGDLNEAEKLAKAIAITSVGTRPELNFRYAVQAYLQSKAQDKINTGRRPNAARDKLKAVLADKPWTGMSQKTKNFYNNLMLEIDPSRMIDPDDLHGVTVDIWMLRAFGFTQDQPSIQQYNFVAREISRIAKQLREQDPSGNWTPHNTQSAIWVALKSRMENPEVKRRTNRISIKNGWAEQIRDEKGKGILNILKPEQHMALWLKNAMRHSVTEKDRQRAKFDYADAAANALGQISWESVPGRTTGHLPQLRDAALEVKYAYHHDISKAFLDENGHDLIAKALGILSPGDFEAPGYWEQQVSPGTQTQVVAPHEYKGAIYGKVSESVAALMDAYAVARGLLLRQDAVGWHRPFFDPRLTLANANGVEISIGRPFSVNETMRLGQLLKQESGSTDLNPIGAPAGVRVINFVEGMDNKAFHAVVKRALTQLQFDNNVSYTAKYFAADLGYVSNNWNGGVDGKGYLDTGRLAGRSDLQRQVRDIVTQLAPRVRAVESRYASKYGWTDAGDIRFQRGAVPGLAEPAVRSGNRVPQATEGLTLAGRPAPGAQTFVGVHYGRAPVDTLEGGRYGTGIRGAERVRLSQSTDERIKRRVYFYIPRDTSGMEDRYMAEKINAAPPLRAEPGLGPYVHVQKFNNILNAYSPVANRFAGLGDNEFESAVVDAGYDGYANPAQGMMVILNYDVPVFYQGTSYELEQEGIPADRNRQAAVDLLEQRGIVLDPRTDKMWEQMFDQAGVEDDPEVRKAIKSALPLQRMPPPLLREYAAALKQNRDQWKKGLKADTWSFFVRNGFLTQDRLANTLISFRRHQNTIYEKLLEQGMDKRVARKLIQDLLTQRPYNPQGYIGGISAIRNMEPAELGGYLKKVWSRYFRAQHNLPDDAFAAHVKAMAEKRTGNFEVDHLVRDFHRAVRQAYKIPLHKDYNSLPKATKAAMNDFLADSSNNTHNLPTEVLAPLRAMRAMIDRLSRRMIDDGVVDGDVVQTILDNQGHYLHRSYQVFDDAEWYRKVTPQIHQAAFNYIKQQALDTGMIRGRKTPTDPDELARDVDWVINNLLTEGKEAGHIGELFATQKMGRSDLRMLKKRDDIAPEIRALLGEYTDPLVNFTKSANLMGYAIANHRMQKAIYDSGKGVWLFEPHEAPPDFTVPLAAKNSYNFGPLSGMYTTPEIARAFVEILDPKLIGDFYRNVLMLNGMIKYGKTVLSVTTMMRNYISAFFFSMANGHALSGDFMQNYMLAAQVLLNELRGTDKELTTSQQSRVLTPQQRQSALDRSARAYYRKLTELGVTLDNPYPGEMMAAMEDAMHPTEMGGSFKQRARQAFGFFTKLYQYGDDFWKILGFESEKAALMRAGMTLQQAEIESAQRIRDTYPTYSLIGKLVKALRRTPLVGTFVSFPAEIIRTSVNIVRIMAADKKAGRNELFARRLVGMTVAAGWASALSSLSMALLGLDDEDDEATRKLAAPWQRNSNLYYVGYDEDGLLQYVDLSFSDPYNYLKRPINALMMGGDWKENLLAGANPLTGFRKGSALRDVLDPFIGPDIGITALTEIVSNQKLGGGEVYNSQAPGGEQMLAIANHLRKAVQPGTALNFERMLMAARGDVSRGGTQYKMIDELWALGGIRFSTMNPAQSLKYKTFEMAEDLSRAARLLSYPLGGQNTTDREEIEDAFYGMIAARTKRYSEMIEILDVVKEMGMTKTEIIKVLDSSGLSSSDSLALANGHIPRWQPSSTFLKRAMESALNTAPHSRREEVRQQFNERLKIVYELLREYNASQREEVR